MNLRPFPGDYPSDSAKRRYQALPDLHLPDALKNMLHLAIHLSITPPAQGGYTYADDVKVSGEASPHPSAQTCLNPSFIGLECVHGNRTARPVRCRKCEGCRQNWRAKVRRIILDGCEGHTSYMWTLTIHEYPHQMKGDRYDFAQACWAKLRRKAQRAHITFRFLRVVELQRRGTPHFHIAITDLRRHGRLLTKTQESAKLLLSLGLRAGFGPQATYKRARLGGAGVASYMSKYLEKGDDYNAMVRPDGRAIRRYNRGHDWGAPLTPPTWRYMAVPNSFSHTPLDDTPVHCQCGKGELLTPRHHASKWIRRSYTHGVWRAPLSIMDYIQKEKMTWDVPRNTLVPDQ